MDELESWNAWTAFASLQASARNFAGLENARAFIGAAREIRRLRYKQLAEAEIREVIQKNLRNSETVSESITGDGAEQGMTHCDDLLHHAA